MKKLVLLVCLFVLPIVVASGCGSLPMPVIPSSTPEPPPTQEANYAPIPVLVPRYYDSENLEIQVGNYSQELKTRDLQALTAVADEMARQKAELTPEQMFVLAIRLYDLGEKDDSVYWFYEAQFRAKLFLKTLDADHFAGLSDLSTRLITSYDAFTKLAGEHINGYAGCDVDNWVKIAQTVKDSNPTPPELDKIFPEAAFVERSQWQGINDEVGAGLDALIDQLVQTKDAIKQQRAAFNLDAVYCK